MIQHQGFGLSVSSSKLLCFSLCSQGLIIIFQSNACAGNLNSSLCHKDTCVPANMQENCKWDLKWGWTHTFYRSTSFYSLLQDFFCNDPVRLLLSRAMLSPLLQSHPHCHCEAGLRKRKARGEHAQVEYPIPWWKQTGCVSQPMSSSLDSSHRPFSSIVHAHVF